ncbi:MAG: class I SAM-dependent methyltransferase family protein [Candidatus Thermoplasmatota archaeon]|jgi:tRNA wybutosine-synthesizing protein 2|nr:class I SAM-dependent methyltransferase family protein [Candidatus Thermoplasmatota archaeon]
MIETPFDQIKKLLQKEIPLKLIDKIPDKWEKIGDVVIIKLPKELRRYRKNIGKAYAEVLSCKTALEDVSGITGVYREPNVEIIYGKKETETIHKENNIRYKLDPQKIMFSSGNMDERIRMATISNKNETVVDLFAGIGYFTLPMAVYSKPKRIFACEINPVAYKYLCDNIVLNNVTSIVQPLFGDNKETAPRNVADRVVMGYIEDTHKFLQTAIDCLKNKTGFIHYHEVCPDELFPDRPLKHINKLSEENGRKAEFVKHRYIKSYAPGVGHYVLDIKIG